LESSFGANADEYSKTIKPYQFKNSKLFQKFIQKEQQQFKTPTTKPPLKRKSSKSSDLKRRLTWDKRKTLQMNEESIEDMENLVPPPKRTIREDSPVVLSKPLGQEITKKSIQQFDNHLKEQEPVKSPEE
jgi:hypothetical protein